MRGDDPEPRELDWRSNVLQPAFVSLLFGTFHLIVKRLDIHIGQRVVLSRLLEVGFAHGNSGDTTVNEMRTDGGANAVAVDRCEAGAEEEGADHTCCNSGLNPEVCSSATRPTRSMKSRW
jgi:hypothetical protein